MLMITFCLIVNVPLSLYCQIGIVLPTIFDFTNCKKQAFGKSCLVGFCMYHKLLQRRIQRHWNTRILPRMAMTVIILLLQWQQEQPRTKHSSFFVDYCVLLFTTLSCCTYIKEELNESGPPPLIACPVQTEQVRQSTQPFSPGMVLALSGWSQ